MKYLKLYFSLFFLIGFFSVSGMDVKPVTSKDLLLALKSQCEKNLDSKLVIDKLESICEPAKNSFKPILVEKKNVLILWKIQNEFSVLGWSNDENYFNEVQNNDLPKNTIIFSPSDFDLWLLTKPALLDLLIQNKDFMLQWLPGNLKNYIFSINKLATR